MSDVGVLLLLHVGVPGLLLLLLGVVSLLLGRLVDGVLLARLALAGRLRALLEQVDRGASTRYGD